MKKRITLAFCLCVLVLSLCGCGDDYEVVTGYHTSAQTAEVSAADTITSTDATTTTTTEAKKTTKETEKTTKETKKTTTSNAGGTYYKDEFYSYNEYNYKPKNIKKYDISKVSKDYTPAKDNAQLKKPAKGEEIAVMVTSMGTIRIRFFEKQSPLAVTNFKELAKQHFYDGMIWHRVFDGFMIQSGDPQGTGYGGQSVYGSNFADEYNRNLFNFRGALSMANAGGGTSTNSSQFFINQCKNCGYDAAALMSYGWPEWAAKQYEKLGGYPSLDNVHTVFGQVIDGMDVVDKIAAVPANADGLPDKNVYIYEVYLDKYNG